MSCRFIRSIYVVYLAALTLASVTAHAADEPSKPARSPWFPDHAFVQAGVSDDKTRIALVGVQWHWSKRWAIGSRFAASAYSEISAGRWLTKPDGVRAAAWVSSVSLVPVLRVMERDGDGWYFDIGVGPSYSDVLYRSSDRAFSTRFNFRNEVGIGYHWPSNTPYSPHDLSLRFEHYSNGGIRNPNPGIDIVSLRYTWRF